MLIQTQQVITIISQGLFLLFNPSDLPGDICNPLFGPHNIADLNGKITTVVNQLDPAMVKRAVFEE